MKRRELLKGGVAAWVGSSLPEGNWLAHDGPAEGSSPAADGPIEIENLHYLVDADPASLNPSQLDEEGRTNRTRLPEDLSHGLLNCARLGGRMR